MAKSEGDADVLEEGVQPAIAGSAGPQLGLLVMARSPSQALDRLRHLAESGGLNVSCEAFEVDVLVAFGSTTDDERADTARDLDLAARFRSTPAPLLEFINEMEGLAEFSPIDVMDLARAGTIGRLKALAHGIPLYESATGLWANLQIAAMLEYMDTAELRRLDRELLKESA